MIGLGSNRLTVCRRGGMRVTQAGRGGMEWLAGGRIPSWAIPYSAQATAALKAQFPTQWPTIRDYGFAHPEIVGYMNAYAPEDAKIAYSLVPTLGKIRGLRTNANITTDIRVYKDNVCKALFMNEYSSTDTAIFSTNPSVRGSSAGMTYWRLFFHSNSWYYDWFNDGGGRVTGGSAQANKWYEVEFGNRYIKDLKTGTYYINSSKWTMEFGETYYMIQGGRGADISVNRSIKANFKVYDPNGNLIGDIIPTIRRNGTGGFINLVTGAFLTEEGGTYEEVLIESPS